MDNPLLVTGHLRSGSTWTGQMLALSQGVKYVHEPFHPGKNIKGSPFDDFFPYLPYQKSFDGEEVIKKFLNRVIRYKVPDLYDVGDIRKARKVKLWHHPLSIFFNNLLGVHPLIKDPIALFASEWLEKNYHFKIVITIRHPAAFVNSFMKAKWGRFKADTFLMQKELMDNYLNPFYDEIMRDKKGETTEFENHILFWRLIYYVVHLYQKNHPDWIFVRHEDLSQDPVNEFKRLYSKLNLKYTNKIEKKILESTQSNEDKRLVRDSKKNLKVWKKQLTQEQVEYIKEKANDIWPYFYSEDDW